MNNKIWKRITSGIALIAVVTACTTSEEENFRMPGDSEVCFTSGIRASSRATSTTFEDGDDISVFAFKDASGFAAENYAANRRYIYSKGRFVASDADNAIVYPEDESSLAFQAIYPYQTTAGTSFIFEVKEDQSINNNYTLSDLMSASTATTTDLTPHLVFSHRLSNIVLNLSFDQAPAGNVHVSFQNVTSTVSADMLTGTFKGIGEQTKNIRTASNGTNSFRAVLPPQSIEAGTVVGMITTDAGDSYTWKMTKTIEWKSGIQYSYDLHVDKEGKVTFTAVIDPWGEPDEPINPEKGKRLKKMVDDMDGDIATIEFSYDAEGRMIGYTMPVYDDTAASPLEETWLNRFSYDGNKIISTLGPNENEVYETVTYTLDTEENIVQMTVENSAAGIATADLTYENGYLTSIVNRSNQNKITFSWRNGLLQSVNNGSNYMVEYASTEDYHSSIDLVMFSVTDMAEFLFESQYTSFFTSAAFLNKLGKNSQALPSKVTFSTDIIEYKNQKDENGYVTEYAIHYFFGSQDGGKDIVKFYYE